VIASVKNMSRLRVLRLTSDKEAETCKPSEQATQYYGLKGGWADEKELKENSDVYVIY
jgi:hypothetical protein